MLNVSLVKIEALNDILKLVEASGEIDAAFKAAVKQEPHFFLMGDATEASPNNEQDLLDYSRKVLQSQTEDERLSAKLALGLGLAASRGIEELNPGSKLGEKALYADAFLYSLYYITAGNTTPQASSIRAMFTSMRQRNTIELHTFIANIASVDEWIELISKWDRDFGPDVEAFAAAAVHPDLAELTRNVDGIPFYSSDDALLQLLLELRKGQSVEAQAVHSALSTEPASLYGQIVRNGFNRLLEISSNYKETAV
ncbi:MULTISPECIES: hypothetical protein [unclassified Paenibacillus]|uniref:hypothetical protein n=1 Tax=unclassified Paenibacillus TaxID=185978 RepID=UPI003645ECB6